MFASYRPILSLLRGTAFLLAASGLHGLLLPLRGQAEGFSTASLGLIGTAWAGGFVAGCFFAPRLVRRAGHVRAFGAFAASGAIVALLTGLLIDEYVWIVLRAFTGFTMAGAFMVIESWLNEKATNENRGTVFGLYMMVTYASIMAGQMIVAAGDVSSASLFMVAGILFCLSLIPTAVSSAAHPKPLQDVSLDLRGLYANSPVSFVACLLIGVANGAWGTLGAVYGARIGISTAEIALMMSLVVVAGAAMQLPAGALSDLTDRRYVLAGARSARRRSACWFSWSSRAPLARHRHDGGLWRARLHALFDRRGACQRPRQAGGFRQGFGRPAAALRFRHDDRPGARRGADGPVAARRACSWRPRCRISCWPPTRCCASPAARRCRSKSAKLQDAAGRPRGDAGGAAARPAHQAAAGDLAIGRATELRFVRLLPHKERMISPTHSWRSPMPTAAICWKSCGAARRP